MGKNTTIAVEFNTDEEAGAVYGTIRKLKNEGYFSAYSMYDDYALIFVPSSEAGNVLDVFYKLSAERELPGIIARED